MPAAFTRMSIFLSAYYVSDAFRLRGVEGCKTHSYCVLHFIPLTHHKISMATWLYSPLLWQGGLYFGQRGAQLRLVPTEECHAGSSAGHVGRDG